MPRGRIPTHGKRKTRTYRIWSGMKTRCYNESEKCYKDYGAKGITVCDRWLNSFVNFLEDMGEAPEGLTLDRIDSTKGYSPENCRWATMREQQNNRSNNRVIEYNGESRTLAEWARILNAPYDCLHARLNKLNWSVEKTLTTKVRKQCNSI